MAGFLRDAKPFSLKFSALHPFVPAESLAGDVQKHYALFQGMRTTCSQPTQPSPALYFLALGLGPGPMPIKLVRAQTRLTAKLISHC